MFPYQLLCAAKDFEHQEQEQAFQNIALEEVSWMLKDSEIVLKHIEDPSMIEVSETEATKSSCNNRLLYYTRFPFDFIDCRDLYSH